MKKYLRSATMCLVAFILALQFGITAMAADVGYSDVTAESPWYDGITYVTELGISNGTGNNCFSPDAPITVRQWSVMLCRAYDQAEALEKDKAEFGTYCSTQAYWNGWIPMEAVTAPDTQMCRGALYQSAFSVIDLPIYNYELYPDGVFLHSHENSVRVATELGICEEGTSASEIATRGEAADLLCKIMTQEYEVIEPPVVNEYPIENTYDVNLSPYLEALAEVPAPIMKSFKDRGWHYAVDFDYLADLGNERGMTCIGACDYGEKHIYVSEASATLHEFGHYLDWVLGWVSRNSSFYTTESAAAGEFMRDYALSTAQEYYADYFVYWLRYHEVDWRVEQMKQLTPTTYAYFTELALNNWGFPQGG